MSYNLSYIATNLKNRYQSKKHGGYDIYEDDKISIWYDTYFPNISVYLMDADKTCVYSKSGHGITSIHRLGKWEEYCSSLMPKALQAELKLKQIREDNDKRDRDNRFGGVNDSSLFL